MQWLNLLHLLYSLLLVYHDRFVVLYLVSQ